MDPETIHNPSETTPPPMDEVLPDPGSASVVVPEAPAPVMPGFSPADQQRRLLRQLLAKEIRTNWPT